MIFDFEIRHLILANREPYPLSKELIPSVTSLIDSSKIKLGLSGSSVRVDTNILSPVSLTIEYSCEVN